jgi:hypothetical protein
VTEREILRKLLNENCQGFRKSIELLSESYENCKPIAEKTDWSADERVGFDALTSRFARSADLFTQKVMTTLNDLEGEEKGSVIDRIHRAAALGIVANESRMEDVRRNRIAHEYAEDIAGLYRSVIQLTPELIDTLPNLEAYLRKKGYLGDPL